MNQAQQAIFNNGNRVLTSGYAVVDGKRTGLAGCSTTECTRRAQCLRANEKLTAYRASHAGGNYCAQFIAA